LIELDPTPADGDVHSFSTGEDATLADCLHRLAHDDGPVAVDEQSDDLTTTAELFAMLEAPQTSPRWEQASRHVTHLTVDRDALNRELADELRFLIDRLLMR